MLYWLLYLKLFHYFPPFRIFRYLTFRTAFASLTALFTGLIIGPLVINRLREFQIGQYIRDEGPKAHQKKAGTPTMGGVLIVISIVVPTLLWADLTNAFVWLAVISTIAFGAIGTVAVIIKQELLLPFIGGIFVIEALSVILQVGSYKLRKKRIFKMAPLHHHFELLGWSESKIIVRFWIASLVFALFALTTLKLR